MRPKLVQEVVNAILNYFHSIRACRDPRLGLPTSFFTRAVSLDILDVDLPLRDHAIHSCSTERQLGFLVEGVSTECLASASFGNRMRVRLG